MLIRMNSLIRGHSGIRWVSSASYFFPCEHIVDRWELVEKMNELISANITPVIPLRGSISASGGSWNSPCGSFDSSFLMRNRPLPTILHCWSFRCVGSVALAIFDNFNLTSKLVGNTSIQVYHGPQAFGPRLKSPSGEVLKVHSIEPIALASKEHLGLINGTAVSAAVAALAVDDAIHLALLAQICTAMGTEALNGTRGSYASFIHAVARPHPGQVSSIICLFFANSYPQPILGGMCSEYLEPPARQQASPAS